MLLITAKIKSNPLFDIQKYNLQNPDLHWNVPVKLARHIIELFIIDIAELTKVVNELQVIPQKKVNWFQV